MPKTLSEKEQQLINKIEKAKKDLANLKQKRKEKIGELAIKAGLANFDDQLLQDHLSRIAQELARAAV
jgi:hypothetical protein